jgi:hypothetical protein
MSDSTVINLLTFFVFVAYVVGLFTGLYLGRHRAR